MAFETRGLRAGDAPGMQRDYCGGGCYALVGGKMAIQISVRLRAGQLMRRWEQRRVSLPNIDIAKNPNQAAKQVEIVRDMERCGSELAKIREQVEGYDPKLASEIEAHPAYKQHVQKKAQADMARWAIPPEPWEGSYYPEGW